MSWLFSRALVEESSGDYFWDGELFALLNQTPTPQAFSSPDKTIGRSDLSRYGMTLEPLTASLGVDVLTWCLAAFPAKPTAAHLEDGLWRTISGRRCGGSWQMLLPGTYSPKTPNDVRSTARRTISERWVTKSAACNFPRETWVLTTFGSGTGFLHTPTHTANYASPSMQKWPNCREFVRVFGKPSPTNHEWLMGWPIGFTDLRPLETGRFRQWQRSHFPNSLAVVPHCVSARLDMRYYPRCMPAAKSWRHYKDTAS